MVAALALELNSRLSGARLRAVLLRSEDRELMLFFRDLTLHWKLSPDAGGFSWSQAQDPPEGARPLQSRVLSVEALPDERYITIRLRKVRGRHTHFRLVVELMTNQWNALLLEGDEGIVRSLLWPRRKEGRQLWVGLPYVPPRSSTREGVLGPISLTRWRELWNELREEELEEGLLARVAFVSTVNLPALMGLNLEGVPEVDGVEEAYRLWTLLAGAGPESPCVLETDKGLRPYPVTLPSYPSEPRASFLEAMESVMGDGDKVPIQTRILVDRLDQALEKEKARIRGLEREMGYSGNAQELRDTANLILARLMDIPKGSSSMVLEGFGGEAVEVALDPRLSPRKNAETLYQEAGRQERARSRIPTLLRAAEERIRELEALRRRLEAGSIGPEEAEALVPDTPRKTLTPAGDGSRLPYLRFRSSGGLEIRVGRGAKDNEELTFRNSHPDDVWLHARDTAGAHVVLRWRKAEAPPSRDLAEAAILAVLNSKHRTSATAPVDWTRRKYVRKARGMPPGTVVPQRVKTLFVTVDPDLPNRLGWWEKSTTG